jgi:hypothetical protein
MKWMKLFTYLSILFIWKWNLVDDCIVMVHYGQGVFFSNNKFCHFIALQRKRKTKIKEQRKKTKKEEEEGKRKKRT